MKKKYLKIGALVAFALVIPLVLLLFLVLTEKTTFKSLKLANLMNDSVTVVVVKSPQSGRSYTGATLKLNGERINECHEVDQVEPCISADKNLKGYAYYDIRNLLPSTSYEFTWTDTLVGNVMKSPSGEGSFTTVDTSEGVPYIGRIYGRVVSDADQLVEGALVFVENAEDSGFSPFAAVTTENGTYNITYTAGTKKNFLQDFTVVSEDGSETTFRTASFYNQPVADIEVGTSLTSSNGLVSEVEAKNSCTTAIFSGIRAQCNDTMPWVDILNTSICPSNEKFFRLGLIEHTDDTHFLNPPVITLKLQNEATGEFLKDPETGEDMVFENGEYVDTEVVTTLELGATYLIKAYGGDKECMDLDDTPRLVYNTPTGPESEGDGKPPEDGGSGEIPPLNGETTLCAKAGENFAVGYEVSSGDMQTAVDTGMRWGEALITDLGGIDAYKNSVKNGRKVGMNMILRLCYKGTCDVEDGRKYGQAVVDKYNELLDSGELPEQGLFIHAGHNEPNNAEYRPPSEEAQFVADVIKTIDNAGILSESMEDIGVKIIGPNMDLVHTGGGWGGCNVSDPGCDDPEPHDTYSADQYIAAMMENGSFSEQAQKVFAWAGNTYLLNGTNPTAGHVDSFSSTLSSLGLSDKVFVTEFGRYDTNMSFDDLKSAYNELDAKENVLAILLFDSIGANRDENYKYHEELWNSDELRRNIISDCQTDTFGVPQEGSSGAQYNSAQSTGGTGETGDEGSDSGVPVEGVGGGEGAYGGNDRCANNNSGFEICNNTSDDPGTPVDGGIVNGDADTHKNVPEGEVPVYWHAWKGESPQPEYQAAKGRRTEKPEYQDQVANKMIAEEEETLDAGIFQHVFRDTAGYKVVYLLRGSAMAKLNKSITISEDLKQSGFDKNSVKVEMNCKASLGISDKAYAEGVVPEYTDVAANDWVDVKLSDGEWELVETSKTTDTGHVTLFTRITCEEPSISGDVAGVSVDWNYEGNWDGIGLWTLYEGNEQFQLGDVSNVSEEYEFCDSTSEGGPDGTPCWDRAMGITSQLPAGGDSEYVLGSSSITLPEKGKYQLVSEYLDYGDGYVYNYTDERAELPVWQDRDGDGVFDDDEYLVPTVLDTQITRVGDVIEFDLKPGISLISVPFYTDDFDEAVEMLNQVKAQGGLATAVASFSNTGSQPGWKSTSQRGAQTYGEDYKLEPGDAVYIVVQEPLKLRLEGADYTQPVEQYVKEGWNLIAMKGGTATMRASELLGELNQLEGVRVTKVTIWDPGRGRYVSYVVGDDGSVYGDDFLVDETMGIFVLVDSGIGYWSPDD